MKAFVYRVKRKRKGKLVKSQTWYARLQFSNEVKPRDLNLGVTDERVANEKLRKMVLEHEQEAIGLLPPKAQRLALQNPIRDLIDEHVADLEALGRSPDHIRHVDKRLHRLVRECGWQHLKDLTAESFICWRTKQKCKSAKTLNEYLAALSALFGWLLRQSRVALNPFASVSKVDTRGKETFHRLALTDEQCSLLLTVSKERMPYYLTALHTALRRGELNQLQWGDFHLDADPPFVLIRASTSKNRKRQALPLHVELVECLRHIKPASTKDADLVFPDGVPAMQTFKEDLAAANIPLQDGNGGRIDFHALRKTFVSRCNSAGVHPRVAMELARHSDLRLTMNTYTDVSHLPVASSVGQLPRFGVNGCDTPKDTLAPVKTGADGSITVTVAKTKEIAQAIDNTMPNHPQTNQVTSSPESAKWWTRGELNPRP